MSEVPHPIPSRTRSLSPPEPMVLCLKAWESRSPPGLPGGYLCNVALHELSRTPSFTLPFAAGWSSPVARQAHNLKVAGSNPAPATKICMAHWLTGRCAVFLSVLSCSSPWQNAECATCAFIGCLHMSLLPAGLTELAIPRSIYENAGSFGLSFFTELFPLSSSEFWNG